MTAFRIVSAATLLAAVSACAALPDAAPTDRLIGAWRVEDVAGTGATGALTMEFSETGQVAGSAGCNRYTGAYAYDAGAGTLKVTPLGVTRRMCLDSAVMLQEARFVDALQNATGVETQADGAVALISPAGRILIRRREGARPLPVAATKAPPPPADPLAALPATSASTAPLYAPAADPMAPQAADPMGAPLFTTAAPPASPTAASPTAAPPPSTSVYPLAGAGAPGAPLYPAPLPTPQPVPATPPATVTPTYAAPAPQLPPIAPVQAGRITAAGEVTLADSLPLPADATLRVQIRDVSRVGAPALVLGEAATPAASGGPHPFSVTAPASVIAPNARLTVFAQVLSGNRLLYITDTSNALPAAGATGLRIRLVNATPAAARVLPAPAPTPTPAPAAQPAPQRYNDVIPVTPPAWASDFPQARPFNCRAEAFRIAFEERVAYLITTDGAVARLPRVSSDEDPGAPQMFSNSRLTVIKDVDAAGRERVRFARGRSGVATCVAQ